MRTTIMFIGWGRDIGICARKRFYQVFYTPRIPIEIFSLEIVSKRKLKIKTRYKYLYNTYNTPYIIYLERG